MALFRYSPDRHAGISGMSISKIVGQSTEELRPVLVTDNDDAGIEEFGGEGSTPPENAIADEESVVD